MYGGREQFFSGNPTGMLVTEVAGLDKDGSRLHTQDQAVLYTSAEGGASGLEVEYTVVEATGRFAGYCGTFRSRGWVSTPDGGDAIGQRAVGVVRFAGEICRTASDQPLPSPST